MRHSFFSDNRGGLLYVPKSYDSSSHPIPLIVVLHGPNGNGREALSLFKEIADSYTLLVMAPDSRLANWEMKAHSYCPDVAYLDRFCFFSLLFFPQAFAS